MNIDTKSFTKALEIASRAIEGRNTIAILGAALVRFTNEEILVTGTDLDMEITATCPHKSDGLAAFALNQPHSYARLFRKAGEKLKLISNPAKGEQSRTLDISGDGLSGTIKGLLSEDDFPEMVCSSAGYFSASPSLETIDKILRVSGACSTEETRYYLNGVMLHHVEGWTYKAVATDGHRLYTATLQLPDAAGEGLGADQSDRIIIPRKFIKILKAERSRMNPDQPITFFSGNMGAPRNTKDKDLAPESGQRQGLSRFGIRYKNGSTQVTITTKLIDGTFPDYSRVMPQIDASTPSVRFKRPELAAALDAITSGMSERTKAVKLTFDPSGKLRVSAYWLDAGFDGSIEIEAVANCDKPFEIGYNAGYLRSICDVSQGDDLMISVANAGAPGRIVSPDATDFVTVLMPMRV